MRARHRNRKLARAAICVLFGVFVVAGDIATAYAQDDDDALPDEKFMRSLLRNLGLRNGQEAGIEYKERPPLVLPPNRNLPPPVSATSLAKKSPAWPDDPDIKKAKAAAKAKAERKPIGYYEADVSDERGFLRQPAAKPTAPAPDTPQRAGASQLGAGNAELTNDELGYTATLWNNIITFGGVFKSDKTETKTFVREPDRASLTDPPAGYRTPSPNQPYGLNAKESGVPAKGYQDPQTVRGELP
jgi:hypothetical protein